LLLHLSNAAGLQSAISTPKPSRASLIARIKHGDPITIDAEKRKITLDLPATEIKARRAKWKAPKARYMTGVLAKYAKLVSSASEGAVTDKDLGL